MMAATTTKRARLGGGSARDRLSALQDELLHRVLSLLPAQEVVRTTVLSRRWTDLWRSVPGINLDLRHFLSDTGERCSFRATWERMENFASNLLILHNAPCLDAFRFRALFVDRDPLLHVDRWVRRAIKDNPLVLELSVLCLVAPRSYQLPHLSSSPCRRLERLQLTGISLDRSFAEQLRSSCPELEHLVLERCSIGFCRIESDKLKNLVVKDCKGQPADVFVVRASALTSVCLHIPFGTYKNGVSLDAGNLLMKASIAVVPTKSSPTKSETILLGSLFNVTSLELKGFQAMAVLNKEFNDVPVFDNLRTLSSLASCFSTFKALWKFMQMSPDLEKLILKDFPGVPLIEPVECRTLGNLRTLILDKCSLHDDFLLLHLWLRNSPNLEKLSVHNCKLTDGFTGKCSRSRSLVQCPKLTCTEITHSENGANIPELVRFMLDITAPHNAIMVKRI